MRSLARFAVRHRWWVIIGWLTFIVAAQLCSSAFGGSAYRNDFTLPHTESDTVAKLLTKTGLGGQTGIDGVMVIRSKSGTVRNPPSNAPAALEQLCHPGSTVTTIAAPWGAIDCSKGGKLQPDLANTKLISTTDPSIGLVDITFQAGVHYDQNAINDAYHSLRKLNSDTLQVEFTGSAFSGQSSKSSALSPEVLGFLAALIILGIMFRTVGAAALPLASAAAALSSGLGLIGLLSHAMSVPTVTPQLAQLMVIGVGVDYALFIVTRHRRNLLGGMSVPDSIAASLNTSGRAVLFAGTTVCIAMLGLVALGVSFFYGMALGVTIAVSLTLAASLTVLPALLSLLGLRVLPRRQRRAFQAGSYHPPVRAAVWARWAALLARRKLVLALSAAAVILTLAVPFFSLRLGHADQGNDPPGTTTRTGYDLIAQGFGAGYNSTLTLVVAGPGAQPLAERVGKIARNVEDVDPSSVYVPPKPLTGTIALVSIKSTSSPQDAKTTDLVDHLRQVVLPPLFRNTRDHVYVYGQTAIFADFSHVLAIKMPLFIGAILLLSFLLLMIAFRSLLVPLTAVVMNVFAAAASFGVVVAIFQWGWGSETLGIGSGGPIEPYAPALFFAILFGLSMDYQVFLVSRIHEEWLCYRDNARAVTVGQAETGGTITAAALIMIAVFSGFVLDENRAVNLIGVGLATAIFIDAFILRTILVPAVMHLLGRRNWYFPSWLSRITPEVLVEPGPASRHSPTPVGSQDRAGDAPTVSVEASTRSGLAREKNAP